MKLKTQIISVLLSHHCTNQIPDYLDFFLLIISMKYFCFRFSAFLDKFGARLSGTKNLENAIDHMINLTRENGITDISTEEVDVSNL